MSTSIARALTRLKHIEQKFEDNINQTILFAVAKGGKCINTGQTKEVFEVEASGKLQGIKDQVSAGVKARLAIAEANMNTKITVAGIEMTIAEALIFSTLMNFSVNCFGISLDSSFTHCRGVEKVIVLLFFRR